MFFTGVLETTLKPGFLEGFVKFSLKVLFSVISRCGWFGSPFTLDQLREGHILQFVQLLVDNFAPQFEGALQLLLDNFLLNFFFNVFGVARHGQDKYLIVSKWVIMIIRFGVGVFVQFMGKVQHESWSFAILNNIQQIATTPMLSLIKKLPVLIYDFFISTFLTIAAHVQMIENMTMLKGNFLDVGCGTGAPLKKIVDKLETYYTKIVGVDLHTDYTQKAQEVFQGDPRVQIHNCDFYEIKQVVGSRKFSTIFFSFSFMLMPDHIKALMLSQSILEKDGRICFLMTLNKKGFPLLEKIKPLIKKITTVDFGRVVYEREFEEVVGIANLQIVKKVRIQTFLNPFLYVFPVYYIECKVKG